MSLTTKQRKLVGDLFHTHRANVFYPGHPSKTTEKYGAFFVWDIKKIHGKTLKSLIAKGVIEHVPFGEGGSHRLTAKALGTFAKWDVRHPLAAQFAAWLDTVRSN